MKRILTILAIICTYFAHAQDGFYIHPQLGIGASNPLQNNNLYNSYNLPPQKISLSCMGQIDLAYSRGNWYMVSGIGMIRPGVYNALIIDNPEKSIANFIESNKQFDPHIIVPVKLGYAINTANPKISFLPEVGADCGFRLPKLHESPADAILPLHQRNFSLAAQAQFNMQYRLNDCYSLTCGPSLQYLLNTILSGGQPYNYSLMFNAGVKYKLNHKKIHKKVVKNARISNQSPALQY